MSDSEAGIAIAFDDGPESIPPDITMTTLMEWIYGDGPRPAGLDEYNPVGMTLSGLNPGESPHVRAWLSPPRGTVAP